MTSLSQIQKNILEVNAAMSDLDKAIRTDSSSLSLNLMARSLEKRLRLLEEEFRVEADQQGMDICHYKLYIPEGRAGVSRFANALSSFQSLFTLVYDALKNGPKKTSKTGESVLRESEFQFAYTFPSSLGIALSIPNERLLLGETDLDKTIHVVLELPQVQSSRDVLDYAARLGVAPIRSLYKWADSLVDGKMGATIEWRRNQEIRAEATLQFPTFRRVKEIISETSEERQTQFDEQGALLGADVAKNWFRFFSDLGKEYSGDVVKGAISEEHPVQLPCRYRATICAFSQIRYSTEEEKTKYTLLSLQEID